MMERLTNDPATNRLLNEVTEYIADVEYPAHTGELLDKARKAGAPQRVIDTLGLLPDRTFQTYDDLVALVVDPESAPASSDEDPRGFSALGRALLPDEFYQ
ncbi:DUF2795 domain-containing protein [Bradymonadaceae bacterium TMQ3]|uniref:DUF2795 domain-containing protein n=1 Tax=Lujinxingia sediminis TaxID=2480984 RepID=A0ABY0CUM6_9DELT|nr:DUF2795 domain-containing protein [Lujinxingia sediminis]RDV37424.1 DUF2795 domain-containing protein [Bradymonadaceae bacterium TMQ3]RVU45879.1 DUF2795 domain-containing protein [Lujinxingia sediminis]TXC74984.1 DUF2795 domain-containing protein [Bradymonadales bacterium TMQ1]